MELLDKWYIAKYIIPKVKIFEDEWDSQFDTGGSFNDYIVDECNTIYGIAYSAFSWENSMYRYKYCNDLQFKLRYLDRRFKSEED